MSKHRPGLARPAFRPRGGPRLSRLERDTTRRALSLVRALALLALCLCAARPAPASPRRAPRRAAGRTTSVGTPVERTARTRPPRRRASGPPSGPASALPTSGPAPALSPPTPSPATAEAGEDPEGRQAWLQFKRAYPSGEIPAGARRAAWAARPKAARTGPLSAQTLRQVWTPLGPAPTVPPSTPMNWGGTSGRINAVAVSPANPQLILVGASTGGIWRSADGGATFAPVSDDQVDLAVSSIVFAPADPSVVYAGMGDIDHSYLGSGLLKSTDAGRTWTRVSNATLPDGVAARVAVDPANPQRVYLAQFVTIDRATNLSAASGVFVSADGGVNWAKKLEGQMRDLVINPADARTLYATVAPRTPTGGQPSTAGGLFRSTDGGETWTNIPVSVAGFHSTFWDFRVAVTPADPQRLYVFYGTLFFGECRLLMSPDGGATWQTRNLSQVDMTQFGYNTYLEVDPTNADTVYLGSRDVWKSTDGGSSFTNLTKNFVPSGSGGWAYQPGASSLHPDQHAFAFQPGNPSTVYLANDGGLWRSNDGGATVQSLNRTGLSLVQFNSLALHPTDGATTVGGTQDNGTQRRLKDAAGAPTSGWADFSGSDGGATFFDPVNPDVLYGTYYTAWVLRFKVTPSVVFFDKQIGTYSTFGETDINTRIAFYPPFTGNGVDRRIYFGTWRLFVSSNLGDTWSALGNSLDLTKGGRDVLNAVAVARSDPNFIYTGSVQGRAMASADGGATWRDATAGLPNRAIERIAVDPNNASVAYLCVSGYGTGHVFRTQDAGQTWADVSGNLPNVPTNALLVDPLNPQTIYAGTDVGVFRSATGGTTWETFNDGLPPVMVMDFAAQPGGRIQAATYGRGAYELVTREVAESTFAFGAQSYAASEGAGRAVVTITRAGDTSAAASVDVRTLDDARAVRCDDNAGAGGAAFARCDYATTVQTLVFAAGETQKTFSVPVIDDAFVEPDESVQLALSNPTGGTLVSPNTATLVIHDNDTAGAPNPILSTDFFVRMQYLDFLSREPEPGQPWSGVINNCAVNDPSCDRISVSANFFRSQEFQLKGLFVFRFYKVSFGRLPLYSEIVADMSSVTGTTTLEVQQKKAAYTSAFAQRPEFKTAYDAATNQQFVDALLGRYGAQQITTPNPATPDDNASKIALTRADLVNRLNASTLTRAQVVRAVADSNEVGAAEFNPAWVAMQYYGYLRRDPEPGGYQAWLDTINANPNDFRSMVNGFMNSQEYRLRFGQP